jgi:F420-non-reducing hydrogenase small subunit
VVTASSVTESGKPQLAIYWAASCGGCEVAFLNLHEQLLAVLERADLFFCPCILDTKRADVEALPDGALAATFFDGAIRTDENEEMAHLLRRKSKLLVAYGACASLGGVVSLANLRTREQLLHVVHGDAQVPGPSAELPLAVLAPRARPLGDVVEVDLAIPGCPPEPHRLAEVVTALLDGKTFPKGAVVGGGRSSVCEECTLVRTGRSVPALLRRHLVNPDGKGCLLEQGVVCMGPATRDGCGALCPAVNMPCTGCYGPPEGVLDQGAKMASALGTSLAVEDLKGLSEEAVDSAVARKVAALPDAAGTFYKYSYGASLLGRLAPPRG